MEHRFFFSDFVDDLKESNLKKPFKLINTVSENLHVDLVPREVCSPFYMTQDTNKMSDMYIKMPSI